LIHWKVGVALCADTWNEYSPKVRKRKSIDAYRPHLLTTEPAFAPGITWLVQQDATLGEANTKTDT